MDPVDSSESLRTNGLGSAMHGVIAGEELSDDAAVSKLQARCRSPF